MDTPTPSHIPEREEGAEGSDDLDLLDLYFAGEGDNKDNTDAHRLLASIPGGKRVIIAALNNESNHSEDSDIYTLAASRVWDKLQSSEDWINVNPPRQQTSAKNRLFPAAGFIPVLVTALVFLGWMNLSSKEADLSTALLTYSTPAGQQTSITLADGSSIELSVASTLKVSEGFNRSNRVVMLDGHARFNVAQSVSEPFVVITKSAAIQVLGTEFVVRDYRNDTRSTVGVLSGRVNVDAGTYGKRQIESESSRSGGYIIGRGELISIDAIDPGLPYSGSKRRVYKSKLSTDDIDAFRGLITFNETPLDIAIGDLARWIGIPISLDHNDPALQNLKISGRFRCTTKEQLIQILERTLDVTVSEEGQTLVVSRSNHSSMNQR